jgi:hypothetical protein
MEKFSNIAEIQVAIDVLEQDLAAQRAQLKVEFSDLSLRLQPMHVVTESVKGLIASPLVQSGLKDLVVGSAAGWIMRHFPSKNSTASNDWMASAVQWIGVSFVSKNLRAWLRKP